MANATEHSCRLCLVAPVDQTAEAFAPRLAAALSAGDIATLFIAAASPHREQMIRTCAAKAQEAGVAVIVQGDTGALAHAAVDGVQAQLTDISDLPAAARRDRIIGVEDVTTRHAAMAATEAGIDYLFFGRLDGDREAGIHPAALDLAAWWASVAVIPSVIMGGRALASVDEAARSGIEFVALGRAIWEHDHGAAAAVAEANARLQTLVNAA
ncbi:MAG: thiamine phosphate synthase [Alphaproteobacteria bacterium]